MNNSIHQIQKATHFLGQNPKSLASKSLLQIHAQFITTGLDNSTPSSSSSSLLLPLLQNNAKQQSNPFTTITLFRFIQTVLKPSSSTITFDDPFVYASLIKACNKVHAIREGKSVHCHVFRLGLDWNVNVLNSLIYFYSNSANLITYACAVFDEIHGRSVVSVNSMMSGFLKNGRFDHCLSLLNRVLSGCFGEYLKPNFVSFVILISGCCEFERFVVGKSLHSYCYKMALNLECEVGNAFINLYSKLGCMNEANSLLNELPSRDLVSWNTMIGGYARNNDCIQAFKLFKQMGHESIPYDRVSISSLITACANSRDANLGKMVHGFVKVSQMNSIASIGITLLNMYSKCGLIDLARRVFEELPADNIAFINAMIDGYIMCGDFSNALKLFDIIKSRNLVPDEATMLGLISACRGSGMLNHGIDLHTYIDNSDRLNDRIVLNNALIDMYAKCGNMTLARSLFDRMQARDVISWTSLIIGYALNGEGEEAIVTFQSMIDSKIEPNSVTFIGVLLACDHAGLINEGKQLYDIMCKEYHIEPRIEHCGCLVNMHARAGMLTEAHEFVKKMGVEPNPVIWRMLVSACRVYRNFDMGLSLVTDGKEVKTLYRPEDYVISSNIYAETGRWTNVVDLRRLMLVEKASKVVGTSSIQEPA